MTKKEQRALYLFGVSVGAARAQDAADYATRTGSTRARALAEYERVTRQSYEDFIRDNAIDLALARETAS